MTKYLDIEKLMKDGWWMSRIYQQDENTMVSETKKITDFPTADVVEVVRCKDCIHGKLKTLDPSDVRYCYRHHMFHFNDYYCADGRRKECGK